MRTATIPTFSNDGAWTNRSALSREAFGPPADNSAALSSSLAKTANAPWVVGPRRLGEPLRGFRLPLDDKLALPEELLDGRFVAHVELERGQNPDRHHGWPL